MRISTQQTAVPTASQWQEQQPARLSATERGQLYHAVFGVPGGASGALRPNRVFDDLWLRFVSSVAQWVRQGTQQAGAAPAYSSERVRADARDLAAAVVAPVRSAIAARDSWQVIDSVAGLELGGAVNAARQREMAQSGGAILEWLAAHDAADAAADAVDGDLAQACEQWLAVTGAGDSELQARSQPDAVSLSKAVSRYIGETEKNLDAAFGDAQPNDAVLRLDEADALFGKRGEVRDSHDRYAHQETQRITKPAA